MLKGKREGEGDENIRHEHRAPETGFSVAALLQEHWRAFSLPQEHLACAAQAQLPSPEVLQQVKVLLGWTILSGILVVVEVVGVEVEACERKLKLYRCRCMTSGYVLQNGELSSTSSWIDVECI